MHGLLWYIKSIYENWKRIYKLCFIGRLLLFYWYNASMHRSVWRNITKIFGIKLVWSLKHNFHNSHTNLLLIYSRIYLFISQLDAIKLSVDLSVMLHAKLYEWWKDQATRGYFILFCSLTHSFIEFILNSYIWIKICNKMQWSCWENIGPFVSLEPDFMQLCCLNT